MNKKRWAWAIPVVAVLLVTALEWAFIRDLAPENKFPLGKDEGWHLLNSCRYYHGFLDVEQDGVHYKDFINYEIRYPPVQYLLSVIPQWICGGSDLRVLHLVYLPFLLLLNIGLLLLGGRLGSRNGGIAAMVLAGLSPSFLWAGVEYTLVFPQMCLFPFSLWVLNKTRLLSDGKWSLAFGLAFSFGFLHYFTFPFYIAIPAAVVFFQSMLDARGRTKSIFNSALIIVVFALCAWFYLADPDIQSEFTQGAPSLMHLENVESGRVSLGLDSTLLDRLLYYPVTLATETFTWPVMIALIAFLAFFLIRRESGMLFLTSSILGPPVVLTAFANTYPDRMTPVLPMACLAVGIGLTRIPRKALAIAAAAILLSHGLYIQAKEMRIVDERIRDHSKAKVEDLFEILESDIAGRGDADVRIGNNLTWFDLKYYICKMELPLTNSAQIHYHMARDRVFVEEFGSLDYLILLCEAEDQWLPGERFAAEIAHGCGYTDQEAEDWLGRLNRMRGRFRLLDAQQSGSRFLNFYLYARVPQAGENAEPDQ